MVVELGQPLTFTTRIEGNAVLITLLGRGSGWMPRRSRSSTSPKRGQAR